MSQQSRRTDKSARQRVILRPFRRDRDLDAVECPRCGRLTAKIIGRSELVPVVYLRCEGCQLTSVAGA